MKLARVTPLYKKNSPLDVNNYRPVSILCVVSKIMERAVYNQFADYLVNIVYFTSFNLDLGQNTQLTPS